MCWLSLLKVLRLSPRPPAPKPPPAPKRPAKKPAIIEKKINIMIIFKSNIYFYKKLITVEKYIFFNLDYFSLS